MMSKDDSYLAVDKNGNFLCPTTKFSADCQGFVYGEQLLTYDITSGDMVGVYTCCPSGDISSGLAADKEPHWYAFKKP